MVIVRLFDHLTPTNWYPWRDTVDEPQFPRVVAKRATEGSDGREGAIGHDDIVRCRQMVCFEMASYRCRTSRTSRSSNSG
jgi:hypothetical protein